MVLYLLVQVRCLSGSDSGLGKAHVGVPVDVGVHQFSDHRTVLRDERFDVFVVSVHHLVRHYALTLHTSAQESSQEVFSAPFTSAHAYICPLLIQRILCVTFEL